ncbi:MaoC family dehydratase [Actinomadura sp. KC345]|uniref:MaoC family dehydratase n=1 Tax=Actinomadura sp. KC345 TaxID=2530371 RepID=UPI0010429885|nr:MaoC family dehydratase [Actinomadura sp. KC345]TDC51320.1 MaoC family dehydratase [Actinomadura sp. KC345]
MTTTVAFEDLESLAGGSLGAGRWLEVDQVRIGMFADATDDHQWIHVDPARAKDGPFGGTIAHGYLTLSLVIPLWTELLDVTGVTTKVNYGLNKVRFPAPVPSGARIRLTGTLTGVAGVAGGGVELTPDLVVEVENGDKPACVLQPVFRFYP